MDNPIETQTTKPGTTAVHLVAPPSTVINPTKPIGRTIPTMLLAGATQHHLTPAPPHSRIIIIGDATTKASATALGLHYTDHYAPILSNPNALKRTLLTHLSNFQTEPSRIICWSDELIHLACSLASKLDIPCELISTKPSAITKAPQNIDIIRVFEPQDHDRWQDLRHTCKTDQLLANLIDPQTPTQAERQHARALLDIDDHTIVIGAVADIASEVDAREFAFLLGLLSVSGYKVLGIVPKSANHLSQAIRHHRGLGQPFRLLTTTDPIPALLPILDAVIHPTDDICGSTQLINRFFERADTPVLQLRHAGKAGFSRAQSSTSQLIDDMDRIAAEMQSQLTPA
tara:strand:- start:163346 stop:164377 length:1032 start_codon:yes stop_codon:yes gene_type:complete